MSKRMKKQLFIYILIMAVLLFFSRTIYNYSLPKVTVSDMKNGTLHKSIEGYAQLSFAKTYDVFSELSGRVTAVYTAEDNALAPFAPVAHIENEPEPSAIQAAEAALNQLIFSRQQIEAEKAVIEQAIAAIENEPAADQTATNLEIAALEAEIANKQTEAGKQRILYEAGAAPKSDYDAAVLAVSDAESRFLLKQADVEAAKTAAEEAKREEIKAKEAVLTDVENRIAQAVFNIDAARADLAALQAVEAQTVTAEETAGVVTAVHVQEGEYIARGGKIATIGVLNENFTAEITESKENAGFVNLNDTAEFLLNGDSTAAVVTAIEPEGELLKIRFSVPSADFTGKEYGKIVLEKTTAPYDLLVPNEAVLRDALGASVWIVKADNGALGQEHYAQEVKIFTADHDENYTAVTKGLDPWDIVILNPPADLAQDNRVLP